MGRTDWEAAWIELGALVASKSGHGRAELLERMAEIAARHQLPENLAEQALRVYGPALAREIVSIEPKQPAAGGGGSAPPDKPGEPRPPKTEGGHDGSIRNAAARERRHAGAAAGG